MDIVELDHSVDFNLSLGCRPQDMAPVSLARVVEPGGRVSGPGIVTLFVATRDGHVANSVPGKGVLDGVQERRGVFQKPGLFTSQDLEPTSERERGKFTK